MFAAFLSVCLRSGRFPPQRAQRQQAEQRAGEEQPGDVGAPVADQAGAELDRAHGDREAEGVLQGQGAADHFRRAGAGGQRRKVRRVGDDAGTPEQQEEPFCPVRRVDREREEQTASGRERQRQCRHAGAAGGPAEPAAGDAAERADADYGKGGSGPVAAARRGKPGLQQQGWNQRPEGIQLPLMPEIGQRRGAEGRAGEAMQHPPELQRRHVVAALQVGAVAQPVDHRGGEQGQAGRDQNRRLPGGAGAEPADAVRQRAAQGQHADQPGQRGTGALRFPADHQLHPQRVDAGQAEADEKTQRHAAGQTVGEQRESTIGQRPADCADGEDAAGGIAVGEAAQGQQQGAADEAELHRVGQRADLGRRQLPLAQQIVGGAVGGKPQRSAEQLGDDDDQDAALHGEGADESGAMKSAA